MAYGITRASPIGELVLNCPVAASVLLEHGFHCIGCGLAAYETIEEGAAAHGFDDAAIDALVAELKEAAKKEEALLAQVDASLGSAPAASSGANAANPSATARAKTAKPPAATAGSSAAKPSAAAKKPDAKENKKSEKRAKKSKSG